MPLHGAACDCRELPLDIDRLWVAGPYAGWLRGAVYDYKFKGETARASSLAALLAGACSTFGADAVIVPVPMHKKRKRERGYDQVAVLATAIGKQTGQLVVDALSKDRETLTQVGLSKSERSLNLIDAFTLRPGAPLPDQVILIDDVATTGSTLTECARALRRGGVSSVSAVVIAHGL
jgi:ComF family protein